MRVPPGICARAWNAVSGSAVPMVVRYVAGRQQLDEVLLHAKLMVCPHCGHVGALNGHGFLRGYAETSSVRIVRGRRLFCSNRGRRPGCGRTHSVMLATQLARSVVGTGTLRRFVEAVVEGASRSAAWARFGTGLCLNSGYRLWRRFDQAQSAIRTTLWRADLHAPPDSNSSWPQAQLLTHLKAVMPGAACAFASFQVRFQQGLLG